MWWKIRTKSRPPPRVAAKGGPTPPWSRFRYRGTETEMVRPREARHRSLVRTRLSWGGMLALALAGHVPGCLFSPPPQVRDPQPERPNININQVVPPVYQVLNAQHNGPEIELTIPFTSVDAGERVLALTWVNWNLEGQQVHPQPGVLPPSSSVAGTGMGGAGAVERSFNISWRPSTTVPSGCNQLTVFITHIGNTDLSRLQPIDFDKASVVTWWVNLDALPGEGQTLIDCPGPAIPTDTTN